MLLLVTGITNKKICTSKNVKFNSFTQTITHIYNLYLNNNEYCLSDECLSEQDSIGLEIL